MHEGQGLKQILDLAVAYGKSKQSAQTGFFHYCYHGQSEEERDTIPLLENFLFSLALLRTRTSEAVLEAKGILDQLLHFQQLNLDTRSSNFPTYLHEYPECKDRYVAAHLLPVFYWIIKQFHLVLGNELRQRLETTAEALLTHCLRHAKEKMPHYSIAIKIAASTKAFGIHWHRPEMIKEGEEMLEFLRQQVLQEDCIYLYQPVCIADILISLQMIYLHLADSPWNEFWKSISQTWHRQTCAYAGPALKEMQFNQEPQATLYDLYLGYFSGKVSTRAFVPQLCHLQAALIQFSQEPLIPLDYPFRCTKKLGDLSWHMEQRQEDAYCVIQKKKGNPLGLDKGFHPLRMLWGDASRVHTLTCQGGCASEIDFENGPNGINLLFTFDEPPQIDEREKNREAAFYLDDHEGLTFTVEKQPSNTFQLEEQIEISSKNTMISMRFESKGAAYFGHLMFGNRPSQINLKGPHRFSAFDRQLFLRAVRRGQPCFVIAKINFTNYICLAPT